MTISHIFIPIEFCDKPTMSAAHIMSGLPGESVFMAVKIEDKSAPTDLYMHCVLLPELNILVGDCDYEILFVATENSKRANFVFIRAKGNWKTVYTARR